jgi:hypothetical protein
LSIKDLPQDWKMNPQGPRHLLQFVRDLFRRGGSAEGITPSPLKSDSEDRSRDTRPKWTSQEILDREG